MDMYSVFVTWYVNGSNREGTNLSVADVGGILAEYLPDSTVKSCDSIGQGMNTLYKLEVTNHRPSELILKVYTHKTEPEDATREATLYQYISQQTAIPVPSVVAANFAPKSQPPWILMENVSGMNYEGRAEQLPEETVVRAITEAGRYLGELHSTVQFDAFGELEQDGERVFSDGSHDNWVAQFDTFVETRIEGASEGQFLDLLPDVRKFFATYQHLLNAVSVPVLVHDDYRIGNMLIDIDSPDSIITAILDWERAMPGHHEYDLVRAEYMLIDQQFDDEKIQGRLRSAFYDGYYRKFPFRRDDAFEIRRDIYRIATILLLMWAFPVVWDEYPKLRKNRESKLLVQHLEDSLRGTTA